MSSLTIKGGRVIDPATGRDEQADLLLADGRVRRLGRISKPEGAVFHADGCLVCPGLIDPHVHLREPGQEEKETIATGAAAAINGGFTSICCMPNTDPALDDDGRIEHVYQQAAAADQCHVFPVGAITKGRDGQELAEIALMARGGAVAFSDDGTAVADAGVMDRALRYIGSTGRPVMQHCQEPALTRGAAMNAGELALRLGLTGWPGVAEELIIQRDVMLNRAAGCRYHVQHVSTAGAVDAIRQARAEDRPVTAEASPHHLLLTEEAVRGYATTAKVNPPLRTAGDVEAVRAGVADGTITVLATDHAPHTAEEKELQFGSAPFGVIGLDCALPLYVKALIETGTLTWPRLIAMASTNPAALCGLTGKGTLAEGADADVTVIDPEQRWTIDVGEFASKARNCPFDGWSVTGRAIATIVAGRRKLDREPDRWKGD